MNIHEYQAKEILKSYGVTIQEGIVADTPDRAVEAAKEEATVPELFSFVVPRESAEKVNLALVHAMDRLEGKNRRARGLVLMAEEYLKNHEQQTD